MCSSLSGRHSTLDVYIFILRCDFCKSHCQGWVWAGSSGDKVQIPWQAWHFVRCAENWWKLCTKHRFEVANLEVHKKTRRKTSILKLQSMKIGGRLARNARFDAPMWPRRVYGGSYKTFPFAGFQVGCHVVLRGRRDLLWHYTNLFDNVSKVVLSLAGAALWRPLSSFCVAGAALQTCRIACSTLYTPHSTLYTPHSTLYTSHSTLHIPHFTLYTLHFTLYTLHSTLYTPHSTLHTLHSTLYTPHSTLRTPHSTLYTQHFTLHTPHFTLHTLHYTVNSTLDTLHSTLPTPHFTLHTPHSTLYTPHTTLYTLHSALHTPHSLLYSPHSTLYTLHSTLCTLHFTPHTPHSTLYTPHFTL